MHSQRPAGRSHHLLGCLKWFGLCFCGNLIALTFNDQMIGGKTYFRGSLAVVISWLFTAEINAFKVFVRHKIYTKQLFSLQKLLSYSGYFTGRVVLLLNSKLDLNCLINRKGVAKKRIVRYVPSKLPKLK